MFKIIKDSTLMFTSKSKYVRAALYLGYSDFESKKSDTLKKLGWIYNHTLEAPYGRVFYEYYKSFTLGIPIYKCTTLFITDSHLEKFTDLSYLPVFIKNLNITNFSGVLLNFKTRFYTGTLEINAPNIKDFVAAPNLKKSTLLYLNLFDCLSLKSFDGLPSFIDHLKLTNCPDLESNHPQNVSVITILDEPTAKAILKCNNITATSVTVSGTALKYKEQLESKLII